MGLPLRNFIAFPFFIPQSLIPFCRFSDLGPYLIYRFYRFYPLAIARVAYAPPELSRESHLCLRTKTAYAQIGDLSETVRRSPLHLGRNNLDTRGIL